MKSLLFLAMALLVFSCKKDDATTVDEAVANVRENTEVAAKEGTGKITLTCNGKQITAEGVCGGIITMGTLMFAVKDKTNPAKVFTIDFNTKDYPVDGKEYSIKPKDYTSDKNPENEVSVSFMEGLPNNKMNFWDPQAGSGKVVFSVNGNEIKCTLSNIKLQSSIYNADDLKSEGTVSGEFTLYKN